MDVHIQLDPNPIKSIAKIQLDIGQYHIQSQEYSPVPTPAVAHPPTNGNRTEEPKASKLNPQRAVPLLVAVLVPVPVCPRGPVPVPGHTHACRGAAADSRRSGQGQGPQ